MYDLICEAFGPDTVKLCFFLLITLLFAAWLVALRRESGMTESWWKYHCRIVGRRTAILGVIFMLCFGYAQQKEEQQQAQQQAVIELFTSITDVVVSTPFSPPSGPATGSSNSLHRESNFLAVKPLARLVRAGTVSANVPEPNVC
jgi:hypothetical protein